MGFDAHCRPVASREVTTVAGSWNGTAYPPYRRQRTDWVADLFR